MVPEDKSNRRSFVKLCASAVAAISASPKVLAKQDAPFNGYSRVTLVGANGKRLRASELSVGETYVFNYPYQVTPCFLINLGRPARVPQRLKTREGREYSWQGGVGPNESIVSFSAICAHKMTHPARNVSFINYRHAPVTFFDGAKKVSQRGQVIYCCSEKSVYDPAQGARVLGGPAPEPLATIALEYVPADDTLYATGTHGGEMFKRFFSTFSERLQLEHKTTDIHQGVTQSAPVLKLSEYTRTQISCG